MYTGHYNILRMYVCMFSIRGLATPWTYFLHSSLSSAILIVCYMLSPAHVLILPIQAVRGLPRLCVHLALFRALSLSPGSSFVFSWCDHSMLASLLWQSLTVYSALLKTHSFVFFAVNEIRSIFLSHFITEASRRLSSFCPSVQLSQPYVAADHTSAFISRIFVEIGMRWLFHIFCSDPRVGAVCWGFVPFSRTQHNVLPIFRLAIVLTTLIASTKLLLYVGPG